MTKSWFTEYAKENKMKKKIVTAVIVIVVLAGLMVLANVLVSNFDIAGFLKNMHGG
jgi:hypothetical protein